MARLKPIHRPAQAPDGLTELEWLAYMRWYREGVERGQLLASDAVPPQESPGIEPGPWWVLVGG
jgi:hypothetical protein